MYDIRILIQAKNLKGTDVNRYPLNFAHSWGSKYSLKSRFFAIGAANIFYIDCSASKILINRFSDCFCIIYKNLKNLKYGRLNRFEGFIVFFVRK